MKDPNGKLVFTGVKAFEVDSYEKVVKKLKGEVFVETGEPKES